MFIVIRVYEADKKGEHYFLSMNPERYSETEVYTKFFFSPEKLKAFKKKKEKKGIRFISEHKHNSGLTPFQNFINNKIDKYFFNKKWYTVYS
jgi:hypothetical protein